MAHYLIDCSESELVEELKNRRTAPFPIILRLTKGCSLRLLRAQGERLCSGRKERFRAN